MLKFDFKKRITAAESLKDNYFEEYIQYPPYFLDSKSSTQVNSSSTNTIRNASKATFPFTNNNNSTLKNKVS